MVCNKGRQIRKEAYLTAIGIIIIAILLAVSANATPLEEWSKAFMVTSDDNATSIQQTSDGGYILTGSKNFEDVITNVWKIKFDANGNKLWEKTFEVNGDDSAYDVQQRQIVRYNTNIATITHESGHWAGSTSGSYPMSFDLSSGGTYITPFKIKYRFSAGICSGTIEATYYESIPIINDKFSYTLDKDSISGQFTTSATANGILATVDDYIIGCGYFSQAITWTANSPDTTPPTITIISPTNGQIFTTPTITISGTASDNLALTKIEVKVGDGIWKLASGTTSWSASGPLSSGSNTIYAKATDTSGNKKETSTIITYNPPTPILTTIIISPAVSSLDVGNTTTFAAAPRDQLGNEIAATVIWSSSNSTVGIINPTTGVFTALAPGTATITAASGAVSGTAVVTVGANGTVTRSFSPTIVAPGGILIVTLTPGIDSNGGTVGLFYQVTETLTAGVSYVSSTADDVTQTGQDVIFIMLGATPFNYTVTVSAAVANETQMPFSGTFKDDIKKIGIVTGASMVRVGTSLLPLEVQPFDTNSDSIIQKGEALSAIARYFSGDPLVPKSTALAAVAAYFSPPLR